MQVRSLRHRITDAFSEVLDWLMVDKRESRMGWLQGQVHRSAGSVYNVEVDGVVMRCRIKGKTLQVEERVHAPIAVGDFVEVARDPYDETEGWILHRLERVTQIDRWSRKHRAIQVLAANVDLVACVSAPRSPPFRPRFIDRLIVAAEHAGVDCLIIVNKVDLGIPDRVAERITDFQRMGYRVINCSAATGVGIEEARAALGQKLTLVCGQSGVGKSSLLNAWDPRFGLRTGAISRKFDRGVHTTVRAELLELSDGGRLIDSPGIRELELCSIGARDIRHHFRDFQRWLLRCEYSACLCDGEPGCAVRAAVDSHQIHPDRYVSYLRLLHEVQERERERAHA